MGAGFPTPERNKLLRTLELDPRFGKDRQERAVAPKHPPKSFLRVGSAGRTWDLPRTIPGCVIEVSPHGGQATKWMIRASDGPDDYYLAKFGSKNGRVEVYTELYNNLLGQALGFQMAHCGVARLDGQLYFVTRNFRRGEALIHGSLMVENLFSAGGQLDHIRRDAEQEFYSVNFVVDVIRQYCGRAADKILQGFFHMLLFDAIIGSMDRHAKNWGVLRSEIAAPKGTGQLYRLAPIFDSARALLWDMPESKLLILDNDNEALAKYAEGSRPCIGPLRSHPRVNRCNHFHFIEHIHEMYPHLTAELPSIRRERVVRIARHLLRQFPFSRGFSGLRKRVILKVLALRADKINLILKKGGTHDSVGKAQDEIQFSASESAAAV